MSLQPIQRPLTQPMQQFGLGNMSLTKPNLPFGGLQQPNMNFGQSSQVNNIFENVTRYINSMVSQMMEAFQSTVDRLINAFTGGQSQGTPSINGHSIVPLAGETYAEQTAPTQTESQSSSFGEKLGSIFNKVGDIWNTGKQIFSLGKDLFGGIKGVAGDILGGIKNIGSSLNLGGIGDFFKNGIGSLLGGIF